MFQDAFSFHGFWREIEDWLTGSYLQKIWQTGPDDFLLAFYRPPSRPALPNSPVGSANLRLRLSLAPAQPFVHPWLDDKPPAMVPNSFCMQIRKHCVGKPILSLQREGLERVVGLQFPEHVLVMELWERRPNLLLCKAIVENLEDPQKWGKILGAHKLGNFERKLLPGRLFSPVIAPSDKPDASLISAQELMDVLCADCQTKARDLLLDRLFGFSPRALDELFRLAGLGLDAIWDEAGRSAIAQAWAPFWKGFEEGQTRPGITHKSRLTSWREKDEKSVSSLYAGAAALGNSGQATEEGSPAEHWLKIGKPPIQRSLAAATRKNARKIEALEGDLAKVSDSAILKEKAELLLAYQSQLARTSGDSISLERWDGSGPLEIALEPGLSPVQQAERYYTMVKKYRRSVDHLQPRLDALREEKNQLSELREALATVDSPGALEAIRLKLTTPKAARPGAKTPAAGRGPRRYRFENMVLWVGRSPRQNDLLITRKAGRDDFWFHVRDGGGAHVLLKGAGSAPPLEAIEVAALLAARHSSRKGDSKVEIVFLPAAKVKKPAGSPPGFVIYHNEMSIVVDPADALPSGLILLEDLKS